MFLKTTLFSGQVPSGSQVNSDEYFNGQPLDISSYNRMWVQAAIKDGIAGTGSFIITSVSEYESGGGRAEYPKYNTAATLFSLDMPEGSWVTASVPSYVAKWGAFVFTPTSASSNTTTGSLLVKASFNNW